MGMYKYKLPYPPDRIFGDKNKSIQEYTNDELISFLNNHTDVHFIFMVSIQSEIMRRMNKISSLFSQNAMQENGRCERPNE